MGAPNVVWWQRPTGHCAGPMPAASRQGRLAIALELHGHNKGRDEYSSGIIYECGYSTSQASGVDVIAVASVMRSQRCFRRTSVLFG